MNNGQSVDVEAPPAEDSRGESGSEGTHSPGTPSRPTRGAENSAGDKVDKIRDLIFGEEMAVYEERFNALEARLVAEVESLRKSVEERLAELKSVTEKRATEVENLTVSRRKLGDSLQKLAEEIRD